MHRNNAGIRTTILQWAVRGGVFSLLNPVDFPKGREVDRIEQVRGKNKN